MADSLPAHIGIILDGNRRWAKAQNLSTLEGHRMGYQNLKDITYHAINTGVKYFSAYMFSTENWDRSVKEVSYLMNLAHGMLNRDMDEMHEKNIKITWLGSHDKLSKKLIAVLKKAEELTKNNTKGTLCLCFNYGGKQEIVDAVKKILTKKKTDQNEITERTIEDNLYGPGIPPVDLVIRTSGEQRLSGFMLWRAAYAEFYFVEKNWPDFTNDDLDDAIADYAERIRRFGK